jgi:O-antigen biosynthesis protein
MIPLDNAYTMKSYKTMNRVGTRHPCAYSTDCHPHPVLTHLIEDWPRMNILVVHESVPRPDKSGCDLRLSKIFDALLAAGHELTVLARFPPTEQRYTDELQCRGVILELGTEPEDAKAYSVWCEGTESRLSVILRRSYDVAILPVWFWRHLTIPDDFLRPIRINSPLTKVFILADDRQGFRQELVASVTGSFLQHELAFDFTEREASYYRSADAVLAISDEEMAYVKRLAPTCPVFCVPFSATMRSVVPDFGSRHGLLFLADFDNFAGRDAMRWFIDAVWPLVLKCAPQLHLTIAGNHSERLLQNAITNVTCVGQISDLTQLFDLHRLFVSPLRIGSGIATKNVLAMSHGLPIITTPVGAQGLRNPSRGVVVTPPTAVEFAASILDHYQDSAWWSRSSVGARTHICEVFSSLLAEDALNYALWQIKHSTDNSRRNVAAPQCHNLYPVRDRSGVGQIILAESFMEQGDFNGAIRQFRYALYRLQFQGKKSRGNYLRSVVGLRKCFMQTGDRQAVTRCSAELTRMEESQSADSDASFEN